MFYLLFTVLFSKWSYHHDSQIELYWNGVQSGMGQSIFITCCSRFSITAPMCVILFSSSFFASLSFYRAYSFCDNFQISAWLKQQQRKIESNLRTDKSNKLPIVATTIWIFELEYGKGIIKIKWDKSMWFLSCFHT